VALIWLDLSWSGLIWLDLGLSRLIWLGFSLFIISLGLSRFVNF
jgi:hypothetical protein